jgi:hypothetical protein
LSQRGVGLSHPGASGDKYSGVSVGKEAWI